MDEEERGKQKENHNKTKKNNESDKYGKRIHAEEHLRQ